jgi:pimeloyl-ACP methyl ester carboxylesterase
MQDHEFFDQRYTIPNGATGLAARISVSNFGEPLLILAHGFAGDKDENGLFTSARDYFVRRGFGVLRFDFRGCGENKDGFRHVRLVDLQEDLRSVLTFASFLSPRSAIGLVSFSLAAAIAVAVNPKIKTHVFWSPALDTAKDMYPRYQVDEILRSLRGSGFFVKAGLEVGSEFLDDLRCNDVLEKLNKLSSAALMIHGTADERIPWTSTKTISERFPKLSFRQIPGAGHSFKNQPQSRELVFSATAEFFRKQFVRPSASPEQLSSFNPPVTDGQPSITSGAPPTL